MFDTCSFKPTNDGFPPSSGGGAVTSVFGRTGVVVAVAGDYTSSEITNSSTVTGTYVTDALNWLDTNKLGTSLTSANIIVGNASNVATAVAMSGDATIINTGALTISNQAVTFAKMQHISSQHLVGRHAAGTGDIQQISLGTGLSFSGSNLQVTGFVPTSLTSANIIVGNNLGVATAVAMSGDTTISNTGAVTIANDAVTTAKILNSNVTYAKIQNATTNRLIGRATAGAGVIEEITLGTNLSFTGTTLNVTGFVPTTLTSANIIVGNGSNVATAVAMSGDIGISNTGATTIQNDAVTTNKILNSNVTYAKIQDVSTNNRLLGRATAGSGVLEEITLGTNLSFTGTTLNAAGGGGYVYGAFTINTSPTNWDKSSLGGANYINLSITTSPAILNISNTGFVANDFIILVIQANRDVTAQVTEVDIILSNLTLNNVNGTTYFMLFNGTKWYVQSQPTFMMQSPPEFQSINIGMNSVNTNNAQQIAIGRYFKTTRSNQIAIGTGSTQTTINSDIFIGSTGQTTLGSSGSTLIGNSFGASTGANVVAVGSGISTSTNTGVVAIGQGITTTNIDAVVIGREASAGGTANVTIGGSATGTGANCVRIGNGVTTSTNTGVVAIGQGIVSTLTATDSIGIGRASSIDGLRNIAIGAINTGTGNDCVRLGYSVATTNTDRAISIGSTSSVTKTYGIALGYGAEATLKNRSIALGGFSYPRHYGAESRRIDTNTGPDGSTGSSRHSDNTSWNGQTINATPKILDLFDVSGEILTLQDNEALHFDIYITAKQNGSTNTLIRRIAGGAVRGAGVGTTTIVGQTQLYTHGTALTTTVSADTTNGAVKLEVTGNANTWDWTAYVKYQRTRTA